MRLPDDVTMNDMPRRIARVSPLQVPLEKYFDYSVPEELAEQVHRGRLVVAPFGKRRIFGIVVDLPESTEVENLKPIAGVVDDFKTVPADLMRLCQWMSQMYLCPLHSVMDAAFPFQKRLRATGIDESSFVKLKRKIIFFKSVSMLEEADRMAPEDFAALKNTPARQRVLRALASRGGAMPVRDLLVEAKTTMETVHSLERAGLVAIDYLPRNLAPAGRQDVTEKQHTLTEEQGRAHEAVCAAMREGKHRVFMLHGVTGSGKTEVYMQAATCCIGEGRKVLILVPEIALGTQIINRFLKRFGAKMAIWHSALSFTERLYEWQRIASGSVDIVVGARSAVFAPLENIGLIIVDEEQEAAYKQESQPRYHAREAAVRRAYYLNCPVVLGSATPSVETFYLVSRGKFERLELTERIGESTLPEIRLVDMRNEMRKRTTSTFSPLLLYELKAALERGEQSLVFLNHRGYNQFAQCYRCGRSFLCPNCSVAMKYHKAGEKLKCHFCSHEQNQPESCPDCGSRAIRYYGLGTEKVFAQLQRYFPDARIERMDRDTTQKPKEYQRIIGACERGEVDILVGTQMIAKGLDFPGVTVVGVVSADSVVNLPEFRASERTFQLLTQVAGRAGRRGAPGKVIVQTFNPEHPAIVAAAAHDYASFYDVEIALRRSGRFPPFTYLVNFIVSDEDPRVVRDVSLKLIEVMKERIEAKASERRMEALGPSEAPFLKLHGKFRWFAALRGTKLADVLDVAREAMEAMGGEERRRIAVDVNPMDLM